MTAVLAAALSACNAAEPIFLRGCLDVPDRETCSLAGLDPATAPLRTRGTIDAAFAQEYTCMAAGQGGALSSPVVLFEAEVQVLDPAQGNAVLKEFSSPITAPLQPDAGGNAAAFADVLVLDASTVRAEAKKVAGSGQVQTVVARFLVVGRLADGTQLATPFVDYPIDVWFGATSIDTGGLPCVGPTSVPADCRLGVDEAVGTSCQDIADQGGTCAALERDIDMATGKSDLSTAHCPTHAPPDGSCCDP